MTPTPTLCHFDAVTCIELVEHLLPEVLPSLTKNIFGYIRPKLVIISTPNADFNVLFSNGKKLRHWDHKFEWTAQEFKNWCNEICGEFHYSVDYDGVGVAPDNQKNLGFCSQFAVFNKIDQGSSEVNNNDTIINLTNGFETVAVSIHPFASAKTQLEKRFYAKFCSCINSVASTCKIMINSNSMEEDKPIINSLQRTFMHLRLSSSNRFVQFHNMKKKILPLLNSEQFVDAFEYGSNSSNTNSYGQKRFMVVVEPQRTTHYYLQKLRDAYTKSCNILPVPGQFNDCETDLRSSQSDVQLKRGSKVANSDRIVDLSNYDKNLQLNVRLTDVSMAEDKKNNENMVIYKISKVLKIPLLLLKKFDEIKSFDFDEIKIE